MAGSDVLIYVHINVILVQVKEAITGFDWDDGNRSKCLKHGVSTEEVESLFLRPIMILPDEAHSAAEARFKAVGKTAAGRQFSWSLLSARNRSTLRPVHQRPLYAQERSEHYEKENPNRQE